MITPTLWIIFYLSTLTLASSTYDSRADTVYQALAARQKGGNNGKNGGNTGGKGGNARKKNQGGKGKNSGAGNQDPQKSLKLDPSVICKGFANNGQEPPVKGQSPSATSKNNFINFCVGQTLTDGKQIKGGSCNPCPIGKIPSTQNMPSAKFVFPANTDSSIKPNTAFTVKLSVKKMQLGSFVNAATNYFAAPQDLNGKGQIIGHTHIVIEELEDGPAQIKALDARKFAFFKGVNTPANGQGLVTVDVTGGLPEGAYRIATINTAANHQPVIGPIAQHGSFDDISYFTVGNVGGKKGGADGGKNEGGKGGKAGKGQAGGKGGKGGAKGGKQGDTGDK